MTETVGCCGLCNERRALKESHLLPAAAFRLARDAQAANPNPIVTTPRGALATSKQISKTFLCAECEDRFSRGGERYILSQCLRRNGQFGVREQLLANAAVIEKDGVAVYDVTAIGTVRSEQYLYFAASVFWRAAANQWLHDGRLIERINLGEAYQEQLRLYLLGKTPFPDNARLFVHVWRDSKPGPTSVVPCSERLTRIIREGADFGRNTNASAS